MKSISKLASNYYFNTFFWNTLQKILNAVVGFITVPLLLKYYGAEQYGILSLATACNGYMSLLDFGLNTGAVRYYSIWITEGKHELLERVSRTNITFYAIIAIINAMVLCVIALYGRSLFSINDEQFFQLQQCLFIIAIFSLLSWGATNYNQLLISDKQMAFTSKMQTILVFVKFALIGLVFLLKMSLSLYFLLLTAVTSSLVFPYIIKCKRSRIINSTRPGWFWSDFKKVLLFSFSVFVLSLFQITATQTRPIVLGMFSDSGAVVNTEFRIIEVIPSFIIMVAASLSSLFLPKTSELVVRGRNSEICAFAYKWTSLTTIFSCVLCFPFIISSSEILCAYVGNSYRYLSPWLIIWLFTTLLQVYSSPSYALIMASGKTKVLVIISAICSILSVGLNAILAPLYGVGSAVIGYFIYIFLSLICYYLFYYKQVLHISPKIIFSTFFYPVIYGVLASIITVFLFKISNINNIEINYRIGYVLLFTIKSIVWLSLFVAMILLKKIIIIDFRQFCIKTKFD